MNWQTSGVPLPVIDHYEIYYKLYLKEKRLLAEAQLKVVNLTQESCSRIPLLLYRLLEVNEIGDGAGAQLDYTQSVTKLLDKEDLQVNLIWVELRDPLKPNTSTIIKITFAGTILGYQEVWGYVKDRVDEGFSLLRPDSFSYPLLCNPSIQSVYKLHTTSRFTYELQVDVPHGYTTASGGELIGSQEGDGRVSFVFKSVVPTWRIDIAVAKFEVLRDEDSKIAIYALAEHSDNAERVLKEVERAVDFYTNAFGELKRFKRYTVIEIPDGWGSQAGDYYNLQTSTAFTDPERISALYHELAHIWNVNPKDEVQRCRWFDEGFASYFEGLAVREFRGEKAFETYMNMRRDKFIENVEADRLSMDVPIVDYGKHELGRNSYSKGAWALYVLNLIIGDEAFREAIRNFFQEFGDKPADFKDFQESVERTTHGGLDRFFDEWLYGTESSTLLFEKTPIDKILSRYRVIR